MQLVEAKVLPHFNFPHMTQLAVGKNWRQATPEQQDALLTLAMNDQLPSGGHFFRAFRQLVITGYYTSEIGMTQEREYLPVPGEYNGEFLYSQVNKVYCA